MARIAEQRFWGVVFAYPAGTAITHRCNNYYAGSAVLVIIKMDVLSLIFFFSRITHVKKQKDNALNYNIRHTASDAGQKDKKKKVVNIQIIIIMSHAKCNSFRLRQMKAVIVWGRLFLVTWVFPQILCRHQCYQTLVFCHAWVRLETCQNTAPVLEAGRRACMETLEKSAPLWSPIEYNKQKVCPAPPPPTLDTASKPLWLQQRWHSADNTTQKLWQRFFHQG